MGVVVGLISIEQLKGYRNIAIFGDVQPVNDLQAIGSEIFVVTTSQLNGFGNLGTVLAFNSNSSRIVMDLSV